MSASLTLFIPALTSPLPGWKREFGFVPESPVLSAWLNSAHIESTSVSGFQRSLFSALGFPDDQELPIARYRIKHELSLDSASGKHYSESPQTLLCADPVHCEAGMKDVTLTQQVRDLGTTETDALISLLNSHFTENGLHFFAASNAHWYVQLPEKEAFASTLLADVYGQNIFPCLPQSSDRNWLALQNEVQMLLHTANINQTREISGLSSVNSLWFWGGGDLFRPSQRFDHVFASLQSTEAQIFANANGTCLSDLSLAGIKHAASSTQGHIAIVLDQLLAAAQATDLDNWQAELNILEQDFIEPLWQFCLKAKLDININTCAGKILTPLKKPRWKFWKPASINLLDLALPYD